MSRPNHIERQADALEAIAAEAARARALLDVRPPRPEPFERREPRRVDVALLLRAVPGLAGQFSRVVPAEHRDGDAVRCHCTARTTVPSGSLMSCAGDCGRWFLNTGEQIHAARPESDAA